MRSWVRLERSRLGGEESERLGVVKERGRAPESLPEQSFVGVLRPAGHQHSSRRNAQRAGAALLVASGGRAHVAPERWIVSQVEAMIRVDEHECSRGTIS